jgi:MarR family transcriptional regulator, organic hydroperoxide resistance regulator
LDKQKVKLLIERYEDVYLFATKSISSIISEQVLEDLSLEQYSMLRRIHKDGPVRASELVDKLGVNKSAITAKVEKLVNKDLIIRDRDDKDRRNVYLTTTSEGKFVYEKVEGRIEAFVEEYLAELSHEDLEIFVNLYEKILFIIKNH